MRNEITCPRCTHSFALDEAINADLERSLREEISRQFAEKHSAEKQRIQSEAEERSRQLLHELQSKAELQSRELQQARENECVLLALKIELEEAADRAKLVAQRELAAEREKIRQRAEEQILDEYRMREADNNKQLECMRRQIDDLKRRAEQGSQQLQGDVQEIELEKALHENFPTDELEPIKTGQRGADILQKVKSDSGQFCGSILWESKRQKNWSDGWITKLLADKEAAGADIGVIVTDVLPKDLLHMGSVRGVLITTLKLATCLAATLRVNLALLGQTRLALAGQDDVKSRVFQYLLSPAFTGRMNSIAEQFEEMQSDLQREKTAITRYWARREKQIHTVASGTATFAGEVKALCGSQLPPMPAFALPDRGNE